MFDSHAHLSAFSQEELPLVLKRAQEAAVIRINNICTDQASLDMGRELSQEHATIYCSAAVHPHDAETSPFTAFTTKGLVAIGETGLDYHYENASKGAQQNAFLHHQEIALQANLPLIIHCREAFEDFFALLTTSRFILHCFTGTKSEARKVLDRGGYLSFSGIVTFKKSEELREIARFVPQDRLLVETDSPFLAPQSKRGARNEPSFLPEIVACLAGIWAVTVEQMADTTEENAKAALGLPL